MIGRSDAVNSPPPSLTARTSAASIRSIPTILFVKQGKVADQVIGAVPKVQLKKKLDALA